MLDERKSDPTGRRQRWWQGFSWPVIAVLVLIAVVRASALFGNAHPVQRTSPSSLNWQVLHWPIVVMGIAITPAAAIIIAMSATLRDRATLDRIFGGPAEVVSAPDAPIVDITDSAQRLRRRNLRDSILMLVVATLVAVLMWYIGTLIKGNEFVHVALMPVALAALTAVYLMIARRRPNPVPYQHQPVLPAVIGIAGAFAVTYLAGFPTLMALGMVVLSAFFFYHMGSMVGLAAFGVMVFLAYVVIGWVPKLLRYTAVPLELAKRLVAGDVAETLVNDQRREVLLLRSFGDDDLTIRTHRSTRHSPVELATAQPFERFEVLLTWNLWQLGPVCAIGRPGTAAGLQPLGAAREYHSDQTWRNAASTWMSTSALIVFVAGNTEGLRWEIDRANRLGVLTKCLFVVPPVDIADAASRLCLLADALGVRQETMPPMIGPKRHVLGVYFDERRQPVLLCADGKDDLAYQALLNDVARDRAQGVGDIVERPAMLPQLDKSAVTRERAILTALSAIDDSEKFVPRPSDGLTVAEGARFVISSLTRRVFRPQPPVQTE